MTKINEKITHLENDGRKAVLITGGGGYIGRLVTEELARSPGNFETIVSSDIRLPPVQDRHDGVDYVELDIRRGQELSELIAEHHIDTVIHLVTVVGSHAEAYAIDVGGSENVLKACVENQVRKLIVTSSGAAYGYHADNDEWLTEDSPLRGNEEFPYSHHKRIVEEMLATYRKEYPSLQQLVLRPGTILGASVSNPISDFFDKKIILGLRESPTPWVFIWDKDVVNVIIAGAQGPHIGVFNLSGDGVMTLREVADAMDKRFVALPARLLSEVLDRLQRYGVIDIGKEQVTFLAHRPVLSNQKLKDSFPYLPEKNTRETFEYFLANR